MLFWSLGPPVSCARPPFSPFSHLPILHFCCLPTTRAIICHFTSTNKTRASLLVSLSTCSVHGHTLYTYFVGSDRRGLETFHTPLAAHSAHTQNHTDTPLILLEDRYLVPGGREKASFRCVVSHLTAVVAPIVTPVVVAAAIIPKLLLIISVDEGRSYFRPRLSLVVSRAV
ncbi:hypothetical protein GGR55DRAFT_477098 [Xylaria sp. FL0064]|nr:hypothetical protein GGR55DRAFT_477098 [Xylaria sp. FL0064]